jgi:hypothetical protein
MTAWEPAVGQMVRLRLDLECPWAHTADWRGYPERIFWSEPRTRAALNGQVGIVQSIEDTDDEPSVVERDHRYYVSDLAPKPGDGWDGSFAAFELEEVDAADA